MRLVVDTNQASLLPASGGRFDGITLSPYVLCEILLRHDPLPTLSTLAAHDVRIGLTTPDVLEQVAELTLEEVRSFKPFPVVGRRYRNDYDLVRQALHQPRKLHIDWARRLKDDHLRYCNSLVGKAVNFRKHLRQHGMSGQKFESFGDAVSKLGCDPDSFLGEVILGSISKGGNRAIALSSAELLAAVLSNQYLGRMYRSQLAYYLSILRLWTTEELNFDPSPCRDDMTDIVLPLYAGDGDVIVSRDKKLSLLVSLIEVGGRVRTLRTDQL